MPSYKLHYFELYGRGEIIRLVLAASGTQYENRTVSFADWAAVKPDTPSGKLPYLEIDGKETLTQSLSIARFLAKNAGLAGKTNLEQAQVDELVDHWWDLQYQMALAHFEKDEEKKEEMIKKLQFETCPNTYKLMESYLIKNNSGDGFYIGKSLTWADLQAVNVLSFLVVNYPEAVKQHQKLYAHYNRIVGLPRIAEYLQNRPKYDF